ncbi:hypothetical protein GGR53DRAFT_463952 [Hypoxylon sp. FL1150]|nr:hypothetical protein GGR53DRAFT_463952 [Hypoxylon sp. FL1150]
MDFSNSWMANMYFKARNGTYNRAKQMVNLGLQENLQTKKHQGFRMLLGDSTLRTRRRISRSSCSSATGATRTLNQTPFADAHMNTAALTRQAVAPPRSRRCWDGLGLGLEQPGPTRAHVAVPYPAGPGGQLSNYSSSCLGIAPGAPAAG